MSGIPGHGVESGDAWCLVRKAGMSAETAFESLDTARKDPSLSEEETSELEHLADCAKKLSQSIGTFLGRFEHSGN